MKHASKPFKYRMRPLLAGWGCLVLLWPMTLAAQAQTENPAINAPTAGKPLTVVAMIKAESDVLDQWQAKQRKVAARARPKPALLSIYGVMPQLRARVMIDGLEVVFEQGRREPLQPQASALRLRQISPPCVSFTHGARFQKVCLTGAGS